MNQPGFWVEYFKIIVERKYQMNNQYLAEQLINEGYCAIEAYDIENLKSIINQLLTLLPFEEQQEVRGYKGTTVPI